MQKSYPPPKEKETTWDEVFADKLVFSITGLTMKGPGSCILEKVEIENGDLNNDIKIRRQLYEDDVLVVMAIMMMVIMIRMMMVLMIYRCSRSI